MGFKEDLNTMMRGEVTEISGRFTLQLTATLSKKGIPCLWEKGGGFTNTGDAQIICTAKGEPKKPIYIRQRGSLACEEHALIPVQVGDVVIKAFQHRGDFTIEVLSIVEIKDDVAEKKDWKGDVIRSKEVVTVPIATFDMGEWDKEPAEELEAAIEAAKEKATCYHCRRPHFITE
jgi:hypothetical protein